MDDAAPDEGVNEIATKRPDTGLSIARQAVRTLGPGAVLLALISGCGDDTRELPIRIVLPEDTTDLEAANNASLSLDPGGLLVQQAIDGTDFSIEVALAPDATIRSLELFLADDEELLAWGRSAPFITAGPDVGLAVFVGRPGRLSTFPQAIDDPQAQLLAARALDRGMVLLEPDGTTFLLNEVTLEIEVGDDLDDPPDPEDGVLVSGADGSVFRVAWAGGPNAHRYDPGTDQWATLDIEGDELGDRTDAASLTEQVEVDETAVTLLHLLGGGQADAVTLTLLADRVEVSDAQLQLDAPRPGAVAMWAATDDDSTANLVMFGGNEVDQPAVLLALEETSLGPTEPWTGGRCAQLGFDPQPSVVCLGGSRNDSETTDALHLRLGGEPSVEELADYLPGPIPDPLWLEDGGAVYAQGAETLVRVDRENLAVDLVPGTALRGSGGHSVTLVSGATFLTGGVTNDGDPLARWQVFMPAIDQ